MFGLTAGEQYTFRVFAVNFNGKSDPSSELTVYACGVPTGMAEPVYVASDKTSITLKWQPPSYVGGCPIDDYEVQRDDKGAESVWTEVNPAPTYIRQDPTTLEFTCVIFPVDAAIGDHYKFRIVASNVQGSVTSVVSRPMTLAAIPGSPSAGPASDAATTNG